MEEKALILDEKAMGRAVSRIAYEILERNKGAEGLCLVGILSRGRDLARRVAGRMAAVEGADVRLRDAAFIAEHADAFPSITVEARTVRDYPYGALAAHVLGYVGSVEFDQETGEVTRVFVDEGSTAGALLGTRELPVNMVLGFKRGIGSPLSAYEKHRAQEDVNAPTRHEMALAEELSEFGALLVTDDAMDIQATGGLAEKAGQATAVAGAKVKDAVDSVSDSVKNAAESAKPSVQKATKAAGQAVNKGAYVTGRQIGRAKGMFSAFKEEFDKARK